MIPRNSNLVVFSHLYFQSFEPTGSSVLDFTNILSNESHVVDDVVVKEEEEEEEQQQEKDLFHVGLWLISTLKRRKKKMNKHKLRKRRKKLRLKSRK